MHHLLLIITVLFLLFSVQYSLAQHCINIASTGVHESYEPDIDLTISVSCSLGDSGTPLHYTYRDITITSTGRLTLHNGVTLAAVRSLTLERNGFLYAENVVKITANTTMNILL